MRDNFRKDRDRFNTGKHFYKLEGDELKTFLKHAESSLYLWTKRGALRHCKSVNAYRAWEVFELPEDNYFDRPANKQLADVLADFVALEREKFAIANNFDIAALQSKKARVCEPNYFIANEKPLC